MKQTTLHIPTMPSYASGDFVVSPCNQQVWQWLEKWPDWPAYGAVLVGAAASGKTHLLHSWQAVSGAVMLGESAQLELPKQPVAIDNADRWADEQQLFHLLNHAKESGQSILLTATTPPAAWGIVLDDLRSRLLSLPVWSLEPPDDALLAALLAKHFSDRQVLVDAVTLRYIISRSERSCAAIQDLARQIDHYALEAKRPITGPLVREWMARQEV